MVLRQALSPAALSYREDGAETVRKSVRQAAAAVKLRRTEGNSLMLRRGPYLIGAGLDESSPGGQSHVLRGRYLNLFDPDLTLLNTVTITPGSRMLLLDLNKIQAGVQKVVAAACRVSDEKNLGNTLNFRADGIGSTNGIVRIAARGAPKEILIGGKAVEASAYDFSRGTVRLRFPNSVDPVSIEVRF